MNPPKDSSESCATCHFGIPRGGDVRACHRNPPVPVQTLTAQPMEKQPVLELRWPVVASDDWCGEYQESRPKTER